LSNFDLANRQKRSSEVATRLDRTREGTSGLDIERSLMLSSLTICSELPTLEMNLKRGISRRINIDKWNFIDRFEGWVLLLRLG
jgi:hypothetical protein